MAPNPLLGVFFHWIGGLASASFYVPYRRVRHWSWEIYWLVGGVFSWLIAPWVFAYLRTHDLLDVLLATPRPTWFWCYVFGVLWGFGGLTFGLTMRYLGLSLGMAVALGLTAAFGTLMPPIFEGQFLSKLVYPLNGQIVLFGIVCALVGIAVVGWAGHSKEKDLSRAEQKATIQEFDLKKGIWVAIFSGIMSACFAYGLAAGDPVRKLTLAAGTDPLAQGLPVLCIVLLGGATTNFLWCTYLIIKNRTASEIFGGVGIATDSSGKPPLLRNYLLCALAGTTWYFQFFFYTMGESQMGRYGFSSWTLHMASIIIFSSLWGFALNEWKGTSPRTMSRVLLGLALLLGSSVIIGFGNAMAR